MAHAFLRGPFAEYICLKCGSRRLLLSNLRIVELRSMQSNRYHGRARSVTIDLTCSSPTQ
jgi:hypothetical protein